MGQYWIPVNLDKKEFIDPHKLGSGLKLWEQLAAHPGTGAALVILCAAERELRGGGDFDLEENWHGAERTFPAHNTTPGPMPTDYSSVAKRTIGRWAGDRIALVGDYAELGDLDERHEADLIYNLCKDDDDFERVIKHLQKGKNPEYKEMAKRLLKAERYTDITDDVCRVIEHELQGKFVGEGWRDFERKREKEART